MSKAKKFLERFSLKPKDFTYNELKRLLRSFGYEEAKTGKTAGSRAAFINRANRHIIRLHKPHPGNILKHYQLNSIEEALKRKGVIQ
jgi:hypothetical protein